ncbi:putative reverse transcriptase domain-containing protein [Tanacetum coccineum]
MSTNSVGTKPDNKAACMNESSPTKPQEKMVWDVNAVTGRYLSTNFVVSDSQGNMIHYTAKESIAHNFLRLKEGGIYSIKNFVVLPNKDEFWILKHDTIMLEFDGETTVWKVSINDVTSYITDVRRTNYMKTGSKNLDFYLANQRGQSLRVTLWGGLGDVLVERITKHVGMCAIVLTSVSPKIYNNKLYLSSSSSTIIYDIDDIPCLKELKIAESCVKQNKEGLAIDSSRPRE